MAEATPWLRMLATALRLDVPPAQFWLLSLKEWRALLAPTSESLTRNAFDALARRFPDETR